MFMPIMYIIIWIVAGSAAKNDLSLWDIFAPNNAFTYVVELIVVLFFVFLIMCGVSMKEDDKDKTFPKFNNEDDDNEKGGD